MQLPLIHLWIGPLQTCKAFGYDQYNKLHIKIMNASHVEGWRRCVIIHICERYDFDISDGIKQGIDRIDNEYKYIVKHNV